MTEVFSVTVTVGVNEAGEVEMSAGIKVAEGVSPVVANSAPDALRKAADDIERRLGDQNYAVELYDDEEDEE